MSDKLFQNILHAFSNNALIHGALMAALGAVAAIVMPLITAWQSGQAFNFPSMASLAGAFFGTGLLYILKNILAGSSSKPSLNDKASG